MTEPKLAGWEALVEDRSREQERLYLESAIRKIDKTLAPGRLHLCAFTVNELQALGSSFKSTGADNDKNAPAALLCGFAWLSTLASRSTRSRRTLLRALRAESA